MSYKSKPITAYLCGTSGSKRPRGTTGDGVDRSDMDVSDMNASELIDVALRVENRGGAREGAGSKVGNKKQKTLVAEENRRNLEETVTERIRQVDEQQKQIYRDRINLVEDKAEKQKLPDGYYDRAKASVTWNHFPSNKFVKISTLISDNVEENVEGHTVGEAEEAESDDDEEIDVDDDIDGPGEDEVTINFFPDPSVPRDSLSLLFGNRVPKWLKKQNYVNERLIKFCIAWRDSKQFEDKDLGAYFKAGNVLLYPANPVTSLVNHVLKGNRPTPRFFQTSKIAVWLPEYLHPGVDVKCPCCSSSSRCMGLLRNSPRRVFDVDGVVHLFAAAYKCTSCKKEFSSCSSDAIRLLPRHLIAMFPFCLTKRSGLTTSLVKLMKRCARYGTSPGQVAKIIKEAYAEKVDEDEEAYYGCIASLKVQTDASGQIFDFKDKDLKQYVEVFDTTYAHERSRNGKSKLLVPGPNYIRKHFIMQVERERDFIEVDMRRRESLMFKYDGTYKVVKLIQLSGFNVLLILMNEIGEVRWYRLAPSESMQYVAHGLEQVSRSISAMKQSPPVGMWADKCCQIGAAFADVFPSLGQNLITLETLKLPKGTEVVYVQSNSLDVAVKLSVLSDEVLSIQHGQRCVVGIDIKSINSSDICVLQFAIPKKKSYNKSTIHIKGSVRPAILDVIFESDKIIWCCNDKKTIKDLLEKNYGYELRGRNWMDVVELASMYFRQHDEVPTVKSLAKTILSCEVNDTTFKKWNDAKLNASEINTAARDAYVPWILAKKMIESILMSKEADIEECRELLRLSAEFYKKHFIGSEEFLSPEVEGSLQREYTRIWLDLFHAMCRVLDKIPQGHPFKYIFSLVLHKVIFTPNEEDIENVSQYLKRKQPGVSYFLKCRTAPKWIASRVRTAVAQPHVLVPMLRQVRDSFRKKCFNDENSVPLLSIECLESFNSLIDHHATKGCLSDPQHISLYTIIDKIDGLNIYRRIAGTDTVEALNLVLRKHFGSWSGGAELSDCYLLMVMYTQTVLASENYRPNFPRSGHFAHYHFEHTCRLQKEIYGEALQKDWWESINEYKSLGVQEYFGIGPIMGPTLNNQIVSQEIIKTLPTKWSYLVKKMGNVWPCTTVDTAEEEILFQANMLDSELKLRDGLNFTKFAERWNHGMLNVPDEEDSIFDSYAEHSRRDLVNHLKEYNSSGGPCWSSRILQKIPLQLEQFYSQLMIRKNKRSIQQLAKGSLRQIELSVVNNRASFISGAAYKVHQTLPIRRHETATEESTREPIAVDPIPIIPGSCSDKVDLLSSSNQFRSGAIISVAQTVRVYRCSLCLKSANEGCGNKKSCTAPCSIENCLDQVQLRCKPCSEIFCTPHSGSHVCIHEGSARKCLSCGASGNRCPGSTKGERACIKRGKCNLASGCEDPDITECERCKLKFCQTHIKRNKPAQKSHRCRDR